MSLLSLSSSSSSLEGVRAEERLAADLAADRVILDDMRK